MLYLLGMLCVGWTFYEVVNLLRPSRASYAAWDQAGHRLDVEEVC